MSTVIYRARTTRLYFSPLSQFMAWRPYRLFPLCPTHTGKRCAFLCKSCPSHRIWCKMITLGRRRLSTFRIQRSTSSTLTRCSLLLLSIHKRVNVKEDACGAHSLRIPSVGFSFKDENSILLGKRKRGLCIPRSKESLKNEIRHLEMKAW